MGAKAIASAHAYSLLPTTWVQRLEYPILSAPSHDVFRKTTGQQHEPVHLQQIAIRQGHSLPFPKCGAFIP